MDYTDFERQRPGIANVRLFHAAPRVPAVDIYANDRLVARRLSYTQFTSYLALDAGTYRIQVFPAGQKILPVLTADIPVAEGTIYTMAVIGILPRIGILPVEDGYAPFSLNRVNIRLVNLSPGAPGIDMNLRDQPDLFSDITYTEASDYKPMIPGNYEFFISAHLTGQTLLYVPARLLPRRNLTFYIVGLLEEQTPPLQVLIPMDGSTYLRT